ncbi:MAG: hypothetical protein WCF84_04955 [Anaerolineae bacterium]
MKSRLVLSALLIAVLMTLVIAMTVSAAPAHGKAAPAKPRTAQLKSRGQVNLSDLAARSATQAVPAKGIQVPKGATNRPIPGKAQPQTGKSLAPNLFEGAPFVPGFAIYNPIPTRTKTSKGLNAYDNGYATGYSVEPPDQGLCVGNGYVFEAVNTVLAVYSTSFAKLTSDVSMNTFYGEPFDNVGDPKCYYDPATKRFFFTSYDIGSQWLGVNIAVSQTSDPRLGWNLYFLDTTTFSLDGCQNACFGDQPLIGANKDVFVVSTNQFGWFDPTFAGADIWLMDKKALVNGVLPQGINVAEFPVGNDLATPDGACNVNVGAPCWYSVQPQTSPTAGDWDTRNGGTLYALSSLDFFGSLAHTDRPSTYGDNRITAWAFTNTSAIRTDPTQINLVDPVTLQSETYGTPVWADQKDDGILPTGNVQYGISTAGPVQTNDDRMNQVVYANHLLWSGVNTTVNQAPANKSANLHAGIAWFAVRPMWTLGDFTPQLAKQGYVAAANADVMFPSIGMLATGRGAMAFSLSGMQYYPTAAYAFLGTSSNPDRIYTAAWGQSSTDGFTEYDTSQGYRPRWGDYSAAVGSGTQIFFASEYIQTPNCTLAQYAVDTTCGDTRDTWTNWGTNLSKTNP